MTQTVPTRPLIGPIQDDRIHMMSFNIRCVVPGTAPGEADHWDERRPLQIELLRTERPSLVGVQEPHWEQLDALREGLGDGYAILGLGTQGGSRGAHSPLVVDTERFAIREWEQFWLSDTPDLMGSTTWGNNGPRVAVWARLADRRTGRELIALNSHFDHLSENARVRSAELVTSKLAAFDPDLPVIVSADFNNSAENSEAYRTLTTTAGLADSWLAADQRLTPAWGTFPDYLDPVEGNPRIDWILVNDGLRVQRSAINVWRRDGRYPSDHAPIQAVLEYA